MYERSACTVPVQVHDESRASVAPARYQRRISPIPGRPPPRARSSWPRDRSKPIPESGLARLMCVCVLVCTCACTLEHRGHPPCACAHEVDSSFLVSLAIPLAHALCGRGVGYDAGPAHPPIAAHRSERWRSKVGCASLLGASCGDHGRSRRLS